MRFYSGFSLRDEVTFFNAFLSDTEYTVAGFSHGAIKALEDVLASSERVDTLQLFSPAFFQTRPEKFKRLQSMAYKKSKEGYLKRFISSCFQPYPVAGDLTFTETTAEELRELLYYIWEPKLLESVISRGTVIEVYLGAQDHIIDADAAREFFRPFATVYFIKQANHFLTES